MNARTLILLTSILIFIGCNSNEPNGTLTQNISGNYIGVFERNGLSSNVQLNLNNGTFIGTSSIPRFPALCNGTYFTFNDIITFENNCTWTADFDWTLILSGEWNFNNSSNILILTKSNGDKYTLTRQ